MISRLTQRLARVSGWPRIGGFWTAVFVLGGLALYSVLIVLSFIFWLVVMIGAAAPFKAAAIVAVSGTVAVALIAVARRWTDRTADAAGAFLANLANDVLAMAVPAQPIQTIPCAG